MTQRHSVQLSKSPSMGSVQKMSKHTFHPERGFISSNPAVDWQHGLLTGNGTVGAIVPGRPHAETLHLSHAGLYLPSPQDPAPVELAKHLDEIRSLCLEGRFQDAAKIIVEARRDCNFTEQRDRFIGAYSLKIDQPEAEILDYQRSVDFLSGEARVAVRKSDGTSYVRTVFASRADGVVVLRLVGDAPLHAVFSFEAPPVNGEDEQKIVDAGIRRSEHGTIDGQLYYRMEFATPNHDNPLEGSFGRGRIVATGGSVDTTPEGVVVKGADEILVLVDIGLWNQGESAAEKEAAMAAALNARPADYDVLLHAHKKIHENLMQRVSFSLDVREEERRRPVEDVWEESGDTSRSFNQIERAFDAGRYNIICSTGHHPPNLQGLWAGSWLAPWYGSFTTNGNLQCAIAFLLTGNTPELMDALFRYCDARWEGFRDNARAFFGMPGFHVPAQITVSPRATDFGSSYPHCYSHMDAPWILQFYYDYALFTGDTEFLASRAYPLMKEAAAFYEAFLTVRDEAGRVVFVPSYSPENVPGGRGNPTLAINATSDVATCRQLLQNCITAATELSCDDDERKRWTQLLESLPEDEVDGDGYFREWLWPGLGENNAHRHASHLYALYDEMPERILKNPSLKNGVIRSIKARLDHHREKPVMAFGLVQVGLAAAHVGRGDIVGEVIELLASRYWSTGMGSFHDSGNLFNMDISGGFPYLCTSALAYADPGRIVFFPAKPPHWRRGRITGLRLRGAILLEELIWSDTTAKATLVSDTDQELEVMASGMADRIVRLEAGVPRTIEFAVLNALWTESPSTTKDCERKP